MLKHIRRKLSQARYLVKEKAELSKVLPIPCDTSKLLEFSQLNIEHIFYSEEIDQEWEDVETELSLFLSNTNKKGGTNPGDRRAIYYLVRFFCPVSVLEIGTHIGSSSVHIAAAVRSLQIKAPYSSFSFDTVDIYNVNDKISKPWVIFGSILSPADIVNKLGCDDFVSFITEDSSNYLSQCDKKYDFIFLDGSHSASSVYRELPASLKLLNKGGCILLHDYFPGLRPLWSNGKIIPGPYLAVRRLRKEGIKINVLPLGRLPWKTKLNSSVSSLALLHKDFL